MDKELLIVILGATLVLVVPGVCGVAFIGAGSFVNGIEVQSLEEVKYPPPIVTLAEFERVERSMSYREVVEIIGDPGVALDSSTVSEGNPAEAGISKYVWQNGDASNMKATFQKDQLLAKSQLFLE